jgi:hypothetical protein
VEAKGSPILRKRPGVSDLGQIWTSGTAQLLYSWNGLWAIYGDRLALGTLSTIVAGASTFTTWSTTDKGSNVTLSGGNLAASFAAAANIMVRAGVSVSLGKYYWEVTIGTAGANAPIVGIARSSATLSGYLGSDGNGWGYQTNGNKVAGAVGTAYGATFTTGDIIGVLLDLDAGTLSFTKNGTSQGIAFSGLAGALFPAASGDGVTLVTVTANFGATAFSHAAPAGYVSGVPLGLLSPSTGGLRFDAQEVGASAATQVMMIKNRTQAWAVTAAGARTAIGFSSSMGAATYAVSGITRSGTTATATLPTDPGVNVGDSITVAGAVQTAYNITTSVTAVTPYSVTPASTVPLTITRSGTTATATSSSAHGLTNGASYTMEGAGQSAYNITATVTVTSPTTFTYPVTVTTRAAYGAAVTWNPADKAAGVTLSGGNLTAVMQGSGSNQAAVRATTAKSSGVAVWEFTIVSVGGGTSVGMAPGTMTLTHVLGQDANSYGYLSSGIIEHSGVTGSAPSYTTGDVIGFVLDYGAGTLFLYKNGVAVTSFGSAFGTQYAAASSISTTASTVTVNFGATAFAYSYDDPASPATGSPDVIKAATTTNATVSYTVSGSPTTPATGTITLTTNGGMVPGLPYIDGYFFVMDNNGVMWQSAIDDPTTWPALSNLTAQNENGKGKALNRSLNYLIAFKEWSTEFFFDTKVPNFSFTPADNGFTEVGCASGESVTHVDGSLIWVSQVKDRGRSVHLMTGLQQQKVSTPDVERILNNDDLATVYAYGLKLGGHSLYLLTLVTSNVTLLYDMDTQSWVTWSSLTAGTAVSVSSITRSGAVATVTTSTAHGLSDGDPVTIAGATQAEYNGMFQVTYVSTTSFTVPINGTPATPATGTITATRTRLLTSSSRSSVTTRA